MEVDSNPAMLGEHMDEDPASFAMDIDECYDITLEDLKHEDRESRRAAIRKLQDFASSLGPERTRDELVPFLFNDCLDDEDELLIALAEELGHLRHSIGGSAHIECLVSPLEALAASEDKAVRDQVIASLCALAEEASREATQDKLVQTLIRLGEGRWTTSRISALGLFTSVYKDAPSEQQQTLRSLFSKLAKDEDPKVRKAAAEALYDLAQHMRKEDVEDTGLSVLKALAEDPQDGVRALTVRNLIVFAKPLTAEERQSQLVPIFNELMKEEESSWQIRCEVAAQYVKISEAFHGKGDGAIVKEHLVAPFKSLIHDPEEHVRTAAAGQITGFAKFVDHATVVDVLLPCVNRLLVDEDADGKYARQALAKTVGDLAPILGANGTTTHLLPTFELLLKDEDPTVCLEVISNLEEVNKVIDIKSLSLPLLEAITNLAKSTNWRVRLKVVERIPSLAKPLGIESFNDHLFELYMSMLKDSAADVRRAVKKYLRDLATIFGSSWTIEKVLPAIRNNTYSHRIIQVSALKTIAKTLSPTDIQTYILPTIIEFSADHVANIRLKCATALGRLAVLLSKDANTASSIASHIRPTLEKLLADSDKDVRFNAEAALTTMAP